MKINAVFLSILAISNNIFAIESDSIAANIERRIVVVVASYNNREWFRTNLDSIFSQKYDNYTVVYIDDCSTDNTGNLAWHYIKCHKQESQFYLVKNQKRKGALANIYHAIHEYCDDNDIVALLDGDDWFKHDEVLAKINQAYNDSNVWLTYGQMEQYPDGYCKYCHPLDQKIIDECSYRKEPWRTSHLRTFYAWLFKEINHEDFLDKHGNFWPMAWDMALMFPMLEMAGDKYKFIEDVLYVYNMKNSLNDCKVNAQLQRDCERAIRNKKPYQRIIQ